MKKEGGPASHPSSDSATTPRAYHHQQHAIAGQSSSASTFGPLPSWFPQSHLQGSSSGLAQAQGYPFADPRSHIHPETYPLLVGPSYPEFPSPTSRQPESFRTGTSYSPSVKGKVKAEASVNARGSKGVASPPSEDEDEEGEAKKKGKKRRRVVVACDTCRRKKVKCEGLPNAANTCNNCQNFGYICTFSVEPERSRGRFEILEVQRDSLLAALRSVAPEMADQFDRGELSTGTLNGVKATTHQTGLPGQSAAREPSPSSTHLDATQEDASGEPGGSALSRESKRDLNPMIPDLEDGRPRYFGGSSNMTSFHHLDSRPPSPGAGSTRSRALLGPPLAGTDGSKFRDALADVSAGDPALSVNPTSYSANRLAVLPRPRPQYPSNSVGWVRHIRKKTLVAIGRDEVYGSEGWFQRFNMPESGLLNELLDLFFQQLNPLLPIVHEHSLRKDLVQGRAEKDSAFRGLVFTILAISSRFFHNDPRVLADPDDPDSAGDHWASASRFHHQVYAASLINVQVLLLTTTFMPATLGIGTSWTVLGVAIRALQDIGLHTEKAYGEYTPFEQEMRRRAFWGAFILDIVLSINLGRPPALRLSDTSVKFPLLASEEALMRAESGGPIEVQSPSDPRPCPAAGFIHLIKLNLIAQDVVNTLYSPRWKPDFASHQAAAVHLGGPPKPSATYKDMTILCKRLDEWVAETPSYLQSIRTSPYKLQAGVLQCGRHDIRLYILKPFMQDVKPAFPRTIDRAAGSSIMHDGSILKKMLLPQCASHARECLHQLMDLCEGGQLPQMVFIVQQAFLSAATFMLTVWHGTHDVHQLSQDQDVIEATLAMLRPDKNPYCSALLRRAQRILCGIAQRAIRGMTDESRKKRVQHLIDLHGIRPTSESSNIFGNGNSSESARDVFRSSTKGTEAKEVKRERPTLSNGRKQPLLDSSRSQETNLSQTFAADKISADTKPSSSTQMSAPLTLVADYQAPMITIDSKAGGTPVRNSSISDLQSLDQWLPFERSIAPPFEPRSGSVSALSYAPDFNGDELAWSDWFSRFLGGLPDPSSPSTSGGVAMSPLIHSTP